MYHAPVMPPGGLLFTSVSAPIDTRMDHKPVHRNYGESSSLSVLMLFAFGDASVTRAAENGRLSTIDNVEYSYLNVLYIYQQFTIRAYGPDQARAGQ